MRVTQNMISNNMLNHLSNSYSKMNKYMDQLTTGKKVNKPSDDPVTVMKGMNYRSEVSRIEQYQRNTGEVHNWMDNTDAALDQATQALQKLRELAVQASNDTYSEEERQSIAKEAEQIKQDLIDIANTKVNGKYIFNGTNTGEAPIKEGESVNFNTNFVKIEVAAGTELEANVNPENVFGDDESNMFKDIKSFIETLNGDNQETDLNQYIEDFDQRIDNVINARADLGARMNRLDLIEDRLGDQEIVATKMMSDNEDVDYAKAITELITQESIHRAALAAGSRIIQPSLVDFLR
ncbi:MAG TPA: flagellar hook-associated protein FlgL [Candidatus Avamphibacillus sp.]|nr:flagellar hook-associated protein FlgL [Candidatus Avamphibacillus sp.]